MLPRMWRARALGLQIVRLRIGQHVWLVPEIMPCAKRSRLPELSNDGRSWALAARICREKSNMSHVHWSQNARSSGFVLAHVMFECDSRLPAT